MTIEQLIQQEAERLYEMCDNPNNDIGIREFNQRNYDRKQSFIEGATFGASLNITKPTKEELLMLAKECMKLPCTDDFKSEEQLYIIHVNHFLKNHTASLNGWVKITPDTMPTEDDGDSDGFILFRDYNHALRLGNYKYVSTMDMYWMKIVKP